MPDLRFKQHFRIFTRSQECHIHLGTLTQPIRRNQIWNLGCVAQGYPPFVPSFIAHGVEDKTRGLKWLRHKIIRSSLPVYLAKYVEHVCLFDWFIFFNLPRFLAVPWRIKEDSIGNIPKAFSTKEVNYKFVCWIKNFSTHYLIVTS